MAIAAAHEAFGPWAETPPAEKARLFFKAAGIVRRRGPEIAGILARETGSTIPFSAFQQDLVASTLEQSASWVFLPKGEVLESNLPGTHSIGVRRPLGVVASFTPWNGANILAWRAVLNPLVAGCTVVVKPSELAPVSAGLVVAEIAEEAGFPPGVINVVPHAPGAAGPIADEFFASDLVRCINLIGGVKTAKLLAGRAAETLKRTVLELGGYNPMIILDDVDVDYAVRMATFGSFFHQGQICLNTRKIIVQRAIYDEFVDKFVARVKTLPSGDPLDPQTIIGPLVTQAAVDLVHERVQEAVSLGATARTGGTSEGLVFQPTVLTDVPYTAAAANEETFGPLVLVERGGHRRAGRRGRQPHRIRVDLIDPGSRHLQGIRDGAEDPARHRQRKLPNGERRNPRTDGRRAQQRLGTHRPRMSRRFQRHHLDQRHQR